MKKKTLLDELKDWFWSSPVVSYLFLLVGNVIGIIIGRKLLQILWP